MKKISIFLLIFLVGCASTRSKKSMEYLEAYKNNRFDNSLKILEEIHDDEEEKSKLLYFMEKGLIYHSWGKYYTSNQHFRIAKDLARKLYTKKWSKKILSMIANDTVDMYYGEIYEISALYFYLVLNDYLINQVGFIEEHSIREGHPLQKGSDEELNKKVARKQLSKNERNNYLSMARSNLLAWDSFLDSVRHNRIGESLFKNDLLGKVVGGMVHEAFHSRREKAISLQLYKDAKDIITKNYNAYVTFNKKSVKFKKNFSRFPELGVENVLKDFVSETTYQKQLNQFLNYKILYLTFELRPRDLKKVVRKFKISEKFVAKVEKDFKQSSDPNVAVLIQTGLIPPKVADEYKFGLEGVIKNIKDPQTKRNVALVGSYIIGNFAAKVLGMVPKRGHSTSPGASVGLATTQVAAYLVGFNFELPMIKNRKIRDQFSLEIFQLDSEGKSSQKVKDVPIFMLNPFGDMAEEAVAEHSAAIFTKTGVRVGIKHLTAILASYGTYKALSGGNKEGNFLAKAAAVAQYAAASKAIEASEKADLRNWSTLPQDIRITNLHLDKGDYLFKLKRTYINDNRVNYIDLGKVSVKNKKQKVFLNYQIKK